MPEILTSEIGEKWIQPEIPLVKAMAQKAVSKAIESPLYSPGDLVESLHPLSKGTTGTILEVLPKSIIFQPEGTNHEQYLTFDQFRKYSPPKPPSKTCRDCGNGKHGSYDTHCQIIDQQVYPENQACSEFVQKSSPSCRECNHFDSSVPEKSKWQFCLLDGTYLKYLDGCDKFKPIIPYSPISSSKKRRQWGDGSGNIQMRPYTSKKGKVYEQYYYCYEIRENGMRQRKGSRYIPGNKLDLIREMEADKKPVTAILYELGLIV